MDIRRVFTNGLREQGVDQSDNRRVILLFEQILSFGQSAGQTGQIHLVAEIFHHLLCFAGITRVGRTQQFIKLIRGNQSNFGVLLSVSTNFSQRRQIQLTFGAGLGVTTTFVKHQHDAKFPRKGERQFGLCHRTVFYPGRSCII